MMKFVIVVDVVTLVVCNGGNAVVDVAVDVDGVTVVSVSNFISKSSIKNEHLVLLSKLNL